LLETRKLYNLDKFEPYQVVSWIGILIVAIVTVNLLNAIFINLIYFFEQGNVEQSIIYLVFLLILVIYLFLYIYINQFVKKIYISVLFTIFFSILFSLTKNSITEMFLPLSFETFVYILVLGFLLLFLFVFIVEKVANERIIISVLFFSAAFAVIVISFILLFLIGEAFPIVEQFGFFNFLLGVRWESENPPLEYGAIPLIWATMVTAFGGIIISVPISLAVAIFIAEIAPYRVQLLVKPIVELLAGIPSVVIGFFGLLILVPFLQEPLPGFYFLPSGSSSFAGMLILAIMALPTITSVAEDAISAVPRSYKEGSLAVGATNWQTISRVTVPTAISGITAAIILGMGRAIGETMAVMMVMGNTPIITFNIFEGMQAITGTLAVEMAEAGFGTTHYHALFGLAAILLVITLGINFLSVVIIDHMKISYRKKPNDTPFSHFMEKNSSIILISMFILTLGIVWLFLSATLSPIGAISVYMIIGLIIVAKRKIYDNLQAKTKQYFAYSLIMFAVFIMLLVVFWVISQIFFGGLPAISLDFLTNNPVGTKGGIFPVIIGTILLVIGTILFAMPIGVSAAIYLVEYQKEGRLTKIIRTGFDLLNGTPSIVYGLFGYAFFVLYLNWGISLLAGQITLGLMILPTVLRTTEEALKSVPQTVREGSLALGATKWQTIRRVVLPPAFPGVLTGAILGIGRAAGETAPILFTAAVFFNPGNEIPSSLFDPVYALPYHLYQLTAYAATKQLRYGTALVLLVLVAMFYLIAIIIRNYYRKRIQW